MVTKDCINRVDYLINTLVREKTEMKKAYNYYNGFRDPEQFKFLEENYGVGNPTSVSFTPIVRKHLDCLLGEFLNAPIVPIITCKDQSTISLINHAYTEHVKQALQKEIVQALAEAYDSEYKVSIPVLQLHWKDVKNKAASSFISDIEVIAQQIIHFVSKDKEIDLTQKLKQLFVNYLVGGMPAYRVLPSTDGNSLDIEVLDPLNTFVSQSNDSIYIKDADACVVRKYMTPTKILEKYRRYLTKAECESLDSEPSYTSVLDGGILSNNLDTYKLPVYYVEWLNIEDNNSVAKYSAIRIGSDIYIVFGKDQNPAHHLGDSKRVTLSVNGIYTPIKKGAPFSLMSSCMDIQDKYDLLLFYRDNLIASSGSIGDWVDLSLIPTSLGGDMAERLQKWIAYKKSGLALLDTTQEGMAGQQLNTIFSGFDNTVKQNAIGAIQVAIDALESTLSSITGVFRERLNGIAPKDAVSNVQQSVTNSYTITRAFYDVIDNVVSELFTDVINVAKNVWKSGLPGSIILGNINQTTLQQIPESFNLSDLDVHIESTMESARRLIELKTILGELVKNGSVPISIYNKLASSNSITSITAAIDTYSDVKRQYDSAIKSLQEQLNALAEEKKKLEDDNKTLRNKIDNYNSDKIKVDKERNDKEIEINWFKAKVDKDYKESLIKNSELKLEYQKMQLRDGNVYNDKIAD